MNIIEIFLIGLSLSMDAFMISVCKGIKLSSKKIGIVTSLFFAIFQFIMPIIGFYFGNILSNRIINYHNYLASLLLIIIGILLIKEEKINEIKEELDYKELIILSIATSIDALIIGISFSFTDTKILLSSIIIGIITFITCNIGYFLGNLINKKIHQYANIIGGLTLIILGIKILINQLGIYLLNL